MHRGGVLEIPPKLNVPVKDVYRAILSLLPPTGSHQLSGALAGHLQKEVAMFGSERVHAFAFRTFLGRRPSTRRGQVCALLLLLCGILWCFVPLIVAHGGKLPRAYEPWLGFGIALSVLSALAWLLLYAMQQPIEGRAAKTLTNAEMVISPTGLALMQGHLKGHLRWDELRDVRFWRRSRQFTLVFHERLLGGIHLVIAGAEIRIPDVYDRPLPLIREIIRHYWKGE
jgi:hypothetical protein